MTIPPDIIPAGRSFSKEITPFKLLACEPLSGKSKPADKITPGLIPTGKSRILLFIRQNDNQIKENLTVDFTEKKLQ